MNRYPEKRQSVIELLLASFSFYPSAFAVLLPFALLLGLSACLYFYVGYLPQWRFVKLIAILLVALLQLYLSMASLIAMHHYFSGTRRRLAEVCDAAWMRMGPVCAGFFLIILILCATFFVGYYIVKALAWLMPESHQLYAIFVFLFVSLPMLLAAIWLLLLLPQLAILQKKLGAALKDSVRWVGWRNFVATFLLYVYLLVGVFLIYPDSYHAHWLRERFLALPFNIVVYLLLLPFLTNYTLLLLNRVKR